MIDWAKRGIDGHIKIHNQPNFLTINAHRASGTGTAPNLNMSNPLRSPLTKTTAVGVALEVGGTNILVVEDNVDDSFMLTRQLAKIQVKDHVKVIDNGQVALDFLLDTPESLLAIFLDLRLPGLSGIELLKKVRQVPRLKSMPVIIMTGSSDPEELNECMRLGVTAILEKPIGITTFIKTVAPLFPKAIVNEY